MTRSLHIAPLSTTTPPWELLSQVWKFVSGRGSKSEFENFVYEHHWELTRLFTVHSVEQLLELNYSKTNPELIRSYLREAIERLPTPCQCCKISTNATLDIGFLKHIEDSETLLRYVEDEVLTSFTLIGTEPRFERFFDGLYFHPGKFYICSCCERCWLVLFDESTLAYHFLEDDPELFQSQNHNYWLNRLEREFGFQ